MFITIGSKQLSVTQPTSKGIPQVSNRKPMEKIQLSHQFIQIMLGNLSLQPFEKKNPRGYTRPRNRWGEVLQGSRWGLQYNRAETQHKDVAYCHKIGRKCHGTAHPSTPANQRHILQQCYWFYKEKKKENENPQGLGRGQYDLLAGTMRAEHGVFVFSG